MAVFTNRTKSVQVTGTAGLPIGLLLSLTYAGSTSPPVYTNRTKNSATMTNRSKNVAVFTNRLKN